MDFQKNQLVIFPSELAQWHALISEAQIDGGIQLDEALESYLVFLLMRFVNKPQFMAGIRAIELMSAWQITGQISHDQLQEVGDKCLLQVGLFPRYTDGRQMTNDYFITLGQAAYSSLSSVCVGSSVDLFKELAKEFSQLIKILQTARLH